MVKSTLLDFIKENKGKTIVFNIDYLSFYVNGNDCAKEVDGSYLRSAIQGKLSSDTVAFRNKYINYLSLGASYDSLFSVMLAKANINVSYAALLMKMSALHEQCFLLVEHSLDKINILILWQQVG